MAEDLAGALNMRAWFLYLSSPHTSDLLTTAEALVPDSQEADELVVSGLQRALREFRQYPVHTDFRVWLFGELVRTYQDPWRRARRWLRRTVLGEEAPQRLPGMAGGMRGGSDAERARAALCRLRAEWRVPLVLRDVAGFTYREIAAVMGLPVGRVQSRIAQARQALGRQLGVTARASTGTLV